MYSISAAEGPEDQRGARPPDVRPDDRQQDLPAVHNTDAGGAADLQPAGRERGGIAADGGAAG